MDAKWHEDRLRQAAIQTPCTKSKANSLEQGEIARLDVGDAYTNGEKIVRVDDIFEDIIFCSVFEAQQPYACLDMVAKSANDVIDELNSVNAQKWTPPEGYAMPLKNFAEREMQSEASAE